MSKKKVLIVTQEMIPYTELTEVSKIARHLPQFVQENGMEIRVLMPRYGSINERRHRLHEVVRLSGMNIIVDDDDFPLIIKVASLPEARMQVYFLDNEEFFKRKQTFRDTDGNLFEDNADRMVFFCKGVIETVKKFGWPPDVIHCHGWMTSLIPFYLKQAYGNEPLFQNSKVIYSLYNESLVDNFGEDFIKKASINNLNIEDLKDFHDGDKITLHEGAVAHSDGIIHGSETLNDNYASLLSTLDKPILEFKNEETYNADNFEFYQSLLVEEELAE